MSVDRSRVPNRIPDAVVGWGAVNAAWASAEAPSVSRAIAEWLHHAGVRESFGVLGGGIAPFSAGLSNTPISLFHCRHEAGAGFAAIEAHFQTGRPGLVVVTTGPGLINTLNAVMAARVDGAKLILVSGFTSRSLVGRGAVQETSLMSMPVDVCRPGSLFHDVALPETEDELWNALARFERGLRGQGGFVAHLGLPLPLQTRLLSHPPGIIAADMSFDPPEPSAAALDACLEQLVDPTAVVWVGHGARGAAEPLLRFVEAARIGVVCSPRGKGVFPETHPLFVGVSGAGGTRDVRALFASRRPRHALVVGTRLGEVTSFLAPTLTPSASWTHVDIDLSAFQAAFRGVPGRGIIADAARFFEALDARAVATGWYARRASFLRPAQPVADPLVLRARGDVRPMALMDALQRRVVEATDAVVMSEAGASFTWCNAGLRFEAPGRYRTSAAWGSMGHFTCGAVGAALTGRRVVAVVGDGAMLMNNEISTAVQYRADVVWVVLNDAQLGLNEHGMTALGMRPVETQLPRTDFVGYARSLGADGEAVDVETDLDAALDRAMAHEGPYVIDVRIDRTIPSPVIADRIKTLSGAPA